MHYNIRLNFFTTIADNCNNVYCNFLSKVIAMPHIDSIVKKVRSLSH